MFETVIFAGQVIAGAWVSCTVTVKEHIIAPIVDVQLTVVVPTGKNDPEAGVQFIVPQVPVGVGAG